MSLLDLSEIVRPESVLKDKEAFRDYTKVFLGRKLLNQSIADFELDKSSERSVNSI